VPSTRGILCLERSEKFTGRNPERLRELHHVDNGRIPYELRLYINAVGEAFGSENRVWSMRDVVELIEARECEAANYGTVG
jgi:hypothetical protein